ncbi:MAG TPA: arginyltransferase [Candidatus Hydrogenedentes bacterium]|nr:arginyltransferase [Candidatus Hydrogenedentota bacterium]
MEVKSEYNAQNQDGLRPQVQVMDILESLGFIRDITEECPYLPHKIATLRYGYGYGLTGLYRSLLDNGYRRSGACLYRPVCETCTECQVIRVPIATFRKSKEQRRIWNRGQRCFQASLHPPEFTEEKRAIYRNYLAFQHACSKQDADPEKYTAFLVDTFLGGQTMELQLRVEGRLAGVGILDQVGDALSTVYFYFAPEYARLSPGTYSALYEIELARRWNLNYYYLGFYIQDCPQMNYKVRFRPCQLKYPDSEEWRVCERLEGRAPNTPAAS